MDPFEGSAISGFALMAVGCALAVHPAEDSLGNKEVSLWTLVRSGGGDHPKKVPRDRVEKIYHQETRIFTPPSWPPSPPVTQKIIDEDKAVKDVQYQWGMATFALTHGVVRLEVALISAAQLAEKGSFNCH